MATDIKLSRFNNTPWGFRLSGGADFTHPLTVVRKSTYSNPNHTPVVHINAGNCRQAELNFFGTVATIVEVARGSIADEAGLQPGDVLIRLNEAPLQNLTHAQAHEWLLRAGNNFVISVVRNHRIAAMAQ